MAENPFVGCITCGEAFSPQNVHTPAGWKEALISGMCEDCFDALFAEWLEGAGSEEQQP